MDPISTYIYIDTTIRLRTKKLQLYPKKILTWIGSCAILMCMDIHLYIWKENQEALANVEKKGELINKLLKVYFAKHSKEPQYTEPESTA